MRHLQHRLSGSQIIILGFAGLILIGTLLLMLPFSAQSGQFTSFGDALFTATSASCVTGLVVQNTATYWSGFGQLVILILIQIGGMGVITMALAIALFSGQTISLRQRSTMQEAISAHQVGGIVRLTNFILRTTVLIELAGAVLLLPVFGRDYGVLKGLWYGLFHSISATCNAGFDLLGTSVPFASLTAYSSHPWLNLVIMALIIIGGLGFLTWEDLRTNRHRLHRYHMQSKVILVTTACLLILPAVFYFFFEYQKLPLDERFWQSLFQTVTARTAGFNTADLNELSGAGKALMIVLMLVGGAPGSTAGGLKITTLAVLICTMISVFNRSEHTHFFGRRISEETVRNALAILTLYLVLFLTAGCLISRIEGLPLGTCLFETASAVGTVGVTLGITPTLGAVSRVILILLMYTGRVGGLTLIFSALSDRRGNTARLPQEKLTVG